jgi:hypothetical protein
MHRGGIGDADRRGVALAYADRHLVPASWTGWVVPNLSGQVVNAAVLVVGLVLATRRPENRIGWLFLAAGAGTGPERLLGPVRVARTGRGPGSWLAGRAAAWLFNVIWVIPPAVLAFVLLLFPTGHVSSRRWRLAGWFIGGVFTLATIWALRQANRALLRISGTPLPRSRSRVATAAFANPVPVGDGGTLSLAPVPAAVQVISTGGMASWQVALIAAGAALAAAAAAVLLDRKLAGRRDQHLMRPSATAHQRPGSDPRRTVTGTARCPWALIVSCSPRRVSARQSPDTPCDEEPASPRPAPGPAQATSMMPGIPAARPTEGPQGSPCHHRRRRAAGHGTGSSERAIPRNQVSLRAHRFRRLRTSRTSHAASRPLISAVAPESAALIASRAASWTVSP